MSIQLGAGTSLLLNITGTYTAIANVISIGGPSVTVNDVDVTVLLSANLFKQFIAGWADGGAVEVDLRYDHLQFATLYTNLRAPNTWRILFPDASKWDFPGYINALSTDVPLEEEIGAPFTIKVSGQPTFTS